MGTASRLCCIIILIQVTNIVSCEAFYKRIPQGFLGVRGKREFELENYNGLFKRKPQFFVGVKGKKYYEYPSIFSKYEPDTEQRFNEKYNDYFKKDGTLIGKIDYASKPAVDSELANNLPLLQELINDYLQDLNQPNDFEDEKNLSNNSESVTDEVLTNDLTKRTAKWNQFFGVRGKKGFEDKRPFDLSFRGKFIGVRGKKDAKYNNAKEIKFFLGPEGPLPKRKGQMNGFFGMRGKKYAEES